MPRRKRAISPGFESFDDGFEEDTSSNSSRSSHPPLQRNAANARERTRMRVLSSAYCRLKTKLPNIPPDTKLSKLDTLRLATIYIQQLKSLLDGDHMDDTFNITHPQSLTWPFTFQQIQSFRQPVNYLPDDWSHQKITTDIYSPEMIHGMYEGHNSFHG